MDAKEIIQSIGYVRKLKSCAVWLAACFLPERRVAIFLFLRKDREAPEFLQVFHRDWGCFLYPGAEIGTERLHEDWIAERCAGKVGLTATSLVTFHDLIMQRVEALDFSNIKRSRGDLVFRVYDYKFYQVRFKSDDKWKLFRDLVGNSPDVKWMSCDDLRNNSRIYRKSKDVISQVEAHTAKGHALRPSGGVP